MIPNGRDGSTDTDGARWGRRAVRCGAFAIAVVGLVACSGGDEAPDRTLPKRGCARVATGEIGEILGTDVTLEKAGKEQGRCTYVDEDGKTVVELHVVEPVEAGIEVLLTDPEAVPDIGNEAWVSQSNAPLGTILLARRKGAMLQVDLGTDGSKAEDEAFAIEIAKAGVPNLPDVETVKPDGPRGDAACEVFDQPEVADLLGGKPTLTVSPPPGSCTLTSADGETVIVFNLLVPRAATESSLDDMVANAEDVEDVEVAGRPARWIPAIGRPEEGGQLDVLDGDRLFQVAVAGAPDDGDGSQALATAIAEIALQG